MEIWQNLIKTKDKLSLGHTVEWTLQEGAGKGFRQGGSG